MATVLLTVMNNPSVPWEWLYWLLGSALVGFWLLAAWRRLQQASTPPETPPAAPDPDAESGTATLEFALVLPVMLIVILLMVQSTLALAAHTVVQHAAYTTARAAVVHLPLDNLNEPRNTVDPAMGNGKMQSIRRAAWFALMPVSGRQSNGPIDGQALADALAEHFQTLGSDPPAWVNNYIPARANYAASDENTQVYLLRLNGSRFTRVTGTYEFGPQDPVGVELVHRLNLSVPYVRAVFADGTHTTDDGPGAYAQMTSVAVLSNQGPDDQLPEPPQDGSGNILPRVDPEEVDDFLENNAS